LLPDSEAAEAREEDTGQPNVGAGAPPFNETDHKCFAPLQVVASFNFLQSGAVWWTLTVGLLPLVIYTLVNQFHLRFDQSVWLIGGYFCYFWTFFFCDLIRPSYLLLTRGGKYFLFTAFVGIPLLLIFQILPPIETIYSGTASDDPGIRMFAFIAGVGVCEELCKALPLLLFSIKRGPLQLREGVFLGIMSGLGFAFAEVVDYSINYWRRTAAVTTSIIADAAEKSRGWFGNINPAEFHDRLVKMMPELFENYGSTVIVQVVRFIPLPLLHAAWAGVVGWFIAAGTHRPGGLLPMIAMGIGSMAVLHGLYDTLPLNLISMIVPAGSVVVFHCYLSYAKEVSR
jgi:RsiW-degrading membrane proteinase PrsW (M82 family)